MTGFIIGCLLIGLAFAAIVIGLTKPTRKRGGRATSDQLNNITSPSRRWHPLNMWNDDN